MATHHNDKRMMMMLWYKLEDGAMPENYGLQTFHKVTKEISEQWESYLHNRQVGEDNPANQ